MLRAQGGIPVMIRNDDGLYEGDLRAYFRIVFTRARNLNNPYHNFRHMLHVTWLCWKACNYYVGRLTRREMRNLLVAALFHDFDHSGTSGPDSVNIERAILSLRRHAQVEDRPHLDRIEALIRATEYPHKNDSPDYESLSAGILRDADLSQGLSTAWIQQVVFGLAAEWDLAPLVVLRSQDGFLDVLRFRTEWAQKEFPRAEIEAKRTEARDLHSLLEPADRD